MQREPKQKQSHVPQQKSGNHQTKHNQTNVSSMPTGSLLKSKSHEILRSKKQNTCTKKATTSKNATRALWDGVKQRSLAMQLTGTFSLRFFFFIFCFFGRGSRGRIRLETAFHPTCFGFSDLGGGHSGGGAWSGARSRGGGATTTPRGRDPGQLS